MLLALKIGEMEEGGQDSRNSGSLKAGKGKELAL